MTISQDLFNRAQTSIPGGVNSPVRAFNGVGGTPLFITKAEGAFTFDADGTINFNEGDQNVPYATRASQTWVSENGEWKVMHSHWSPRTNSQGIPQEN